ncbi:MAG: hypothetical protein CO183_01655 [Candidatus Zambryskibacteria bacterium CG_4_9_14_3_um_filter_42_9]|uniref:Lipoprotein n=1 Tax=Candidatus Zambryskibacteria bacterium CG22_combo_CG10-13_8_21_14_all_42_17 TaxID=1975118 RepID=A0A2H0BCP6_9BACT|nr:MAG: hypothetical protein COX06_03120 [Candidatus Zambryskibacteria bacterium CG22_combo_CG10-13_8_21_14_all_42_17]PJA36772.1 MAG: hypothetical protein CO183_01655 [Candidatus Zambryskibacteria bacterium CG_4_9_14_3_um_filter_42_9]
MKKLFLIIVVAGLLSGCLTRVESSGRTIIFLQRGVVVSITHTCTEHFAVYQAGPGLIMKAQGSNPVQVPLVPALWGDQQIHVIVQSLNENGQIMGTYGQTFQVNQNSTIARSWIISNQRGWSGGGGIVSSCNF